jgi:site-specific DNA recombinase
MKPTLTKKPRCILYCRVSDDEQRKNTSLESQEEFGRKFCADRNMVVDRVFYEDHSAKTFARPEWKLLINYMKKNRKYIDYLFVYDYTRFGRNTSESFFWHAAIMKLNIEVQSITQWINYDIPEHVYQLGIFFAGPEVDNKWRSIKTTNGMRFRMKQGIYVHGKLPVGYVKDRNTGQIHHDPRAPLIRQAFSLIYKGSSISTMTEKMKALGLTRPLKSWSKTLRNTYYKGWISNQLLDEPVKAVNMTPIVPEDLFDAVQDILNGRRPATVKHADEYPLKSFCSCGHCSGSLTGYKVTKKKLVSGSYIKKRTAMYYYICNTSGCRTNFSMKQLHAGFENILRSMEIDETIAPLIRARLEVVFRKLHGDTIAENVNTRKALTKLNTRLENLNIRFIDGHLDSEEYQAMKSRMLGERRQLEEMLKPEFTLSNPSEMIAKSLNFLTDLSNTWKKHGLEDKRHMQRVLFPKGITYNKQKKQYRTPAVNRYISLISTLGVPKSTKAAEFQGEFSGLVVSGSP